MLWNHREQVTKGVQGLTLDRPKTDKSFNDTLNYFDILYLGSIPKAGKVTPARFGLATSTMRMECSIRLSYGAMKKCKGELSIPLRLPVTVA